MKDTSSRPRNLCWTIAFVGALLFAVGVFIMLTGRCSVMTPALLAALNVVLFGVLGAWRCSFARSQALEEEGVRIYREEHGNSELFEDGDEAVRLATRANQQFTKIAVPIITIVIGVAETVFCLVKWRIWSKTEFFPVAENPMPLAILGICCCIGVLIAGSFFIGASRESGCRWLRPAGAWLFFAGFLYLLAGVALFFEFFGKFADTADIFIAKIALVVMTALAIELIFSFVIEFYRPRMPGEEERPLPESRILALFTEPGGVARNVAASLDYQFGFQVSEAWFYHFLERTVVPLIIIMALGMWLQTCLVVVSTEENGIKERFGRVVSQQPLPPGLYWKLPAPFETMHRFEVEHVQSITLGGHEEEEEHEEAKPKDDGHGHAKKEKKEEHDEKIVLWSSQHAEEEKPFIVAMKAAANTSGQTTPGAPPLSIGLLAAHIPMYYKVNNMYLYFYKHNDSAKTLKNMATRELVRYLASADFDELLGEKRHFAGEILRKRIQDVCDKAELGVDIVFVSLAGLHPPVSTGNAYDKVVASREERQELILQAKAYAAGSDPVVQAAKVSLIQQAMAYKLEKTRVPEAEAARFRSQLMGYRACPSIFKLNSFLDVLINDASKARKYIIAGNGNSEILNLNLEKKLTSGLLDLNVEDDEQQAPADGNNAAQGQQPAK